MAFIEQSKALSNSVSKAVTTLLKTEMKLSDYLVNYLEKITDSVFLLSGGGIMHLVDSLGRSKLNAYCCHHEQAAAIAAEGYARIKNDVGVVLVTTGPGGTNAITGVAGAWLDSIPMLVLNGQVKTDNIAPKREGKPLIRALGLQELNNVDLVKPITKYAVTILDPDKIRYHLEKALYLARSGRPGPVWLEIPLDIQAAPINVKKLKGFTPPHESTPKIPFSQVVSILKKSQRPLFLAGNGIRLAGGEVILQKVLNKFKFNAVTPLFTADDLITDQYPHYLGRQGMWGDQAANYAVDNCDLLLVIGERMQLTQTSYDYQSFATQAVKIMVDIDQEELNKKNFRPDLKIHCDAKIFLEKLLSQEFTLNRWDVPIKPINPGDYAVPKKYLNVYRFIEELNKQNNGHDVVTANGMASLAPHQALKILPGQRFLTNAGLGHMGSGLPMAIGACIARGKKPVICTEGDGSIMLNLQELQTVVHHQLPLKIFIFNNNGYYSIRNTHLNYFNKIFAADPSSGVTLPNFEKIAKAFGIEYLKTANDQELPKVKKVIDFKGPIICELILSPDQPLLPKWTAGQYKKTMTES